jgi:signal transduction histidine kinase
VQLLQNLIGNAIKYCEASEPRVHVSAIPYRVTRWLVSIEDNGIGIAEADRERIFEAFHRLHDRRRYEGTGLGLATCKKIVERHGGKIWCTSNEARGTTFFFDLADPMIGDTGPLRAD